MHDFVGVRGVIAPGRLAELSERRNAPGLLYLASHWGAIAASSTAMYFAWGTWWSVPLFMLQGVLVNFLYAPAHECDHNTAFQSRWLNVWIGRVCGFLIFSSSEHHRLSHFTHHRNTQNWDKDTELRRPRFNTVGVYVVHLTGFPLVWSKVTGIFRHAFVGADEWFMTPAQRRRVVRAARWHVAGYALAGASAVALTSWWPLYYWWGPFVLMRWTYVLQGLGEHTGLTHEPNTLLNTRTLKTNAFMRWVNWNMTYHTVHHTFPSVPFFRLPQLHREVEQRQGFELPSSPYLQLHWKHLQALRAGLTELDICAEHHASLIAEGKLPAPLPRSA